MSRQYYGGAEAIDQLHPSSRALPLSMSQQVCDSPRTYPINRQQHQMSPIPDSDSEKGGSSARKRIGLACARCRKRKIKCSGDQGHGICQNCKNAGMEPGTCLFLRVNSDVMSINQPSAAPVSWSYQHSGLLHSRSGSTVGPYSTMPAPATYTAAPMPPNPFASSMPYARYQPSNSQTGLSYNSNRQSLPTNPNWLSEDLAESYPMAHSQYNLPAQDSQLSAANYTSSDMLKPWANTNAARHLQQNFSLDQDGSTKYAAPLFPLLSAPLPTNSGGVPEGNSQFPAMNTLRTSLPYQHSRILPAPDSKRGSMSRSYSNLSATIAEDPATSLSQPIGHRPSFQWNPEHSGTEGNQTSAGSSTSSTASGTEGVSSNSSSSPQTLQRPTTFGYRPAQQSQEAEYSAPYTSSSPALNKRHATVDNRDFSGDLSNESILRDQDPTTSQYTYTLGSGAGAPKGTLVNGQDYTRLKEPSNTQTYEPYNHVQNQPVAYPSHRKSVSNTRSH